MLRELIKPPLNKSFNEIYQSIDREPLKQTPILLTTGGVLFVAKAKAAKDGRRFIALPHSNRIYEGDWGYRTNSMGKDGQRIGHYSVPLDQWVV